VHVFLLYTIQFAQLRSSLLYPYLSVSYTSSPMPSHAISQAHNGTTQFLLLTTYQSIPSLGGNATLHPRTSTLLQMSQVLPASRVPRSHVLLHAICESGLLGGRDGRARVGDGALEAVLVDFLGGIISMVTQGAFASYNLGIDTRGVKGSSE
jgi:hypothetical protein